MSEKTCHGCGLEDADACVEGKHVPAIDPHEGPCLYCIRNPYPRDNWNEAYVLDDRR